MQDFNNLFQQAAHLKSQEMVKKRKKFEKQPQFIKAGLYYLIKFQEQRQSSFEEKYKLSDQLRLEGNSLYQQDKFTEASRLYEQALSIFLYISNTNSKWKNEGIIDDELLYIDDLGSNNQQKDLILILREKILLNLSACYIKMKAYSDSIQACNYVLQINPSSVKAFFRRAKARTDSINASEQDYKLALQDLNQAAKYSKDSDELSEINRQLKTFKKEISLMNNQTKKLYTNMFKNLNDQSQNIQKDTSEQEKLINSQSRINRYLKFATYQKLLGCIAFGIILQIILKFYL